MSNVSGNPFDDLTVPRGGPVSGGKRSPLPGVPGPHVWSDGAVQDVGDGVDVELDFSTLEAVNADLVQLRQRMNRVRRRMREAQRAAVDAKLEYVRAFRRALVAQSGGSAESRKAHAELQVESLETDLRVAEQVAEEYMTLWRTAREDMESAKVVAYNLRALL
jgi:hypothetical protein